jgi:predicted class III extradiol MEMO1 family dioxygenase/AMMECR1 domain-containing protein
MTPSSSSSPPILALIPHAGAQYAGGARQSVFEHIAQTRKQIDFVYYLAAIHAPLDKADQAADHLYSACPVPDFQPPHLASLSSSLPSSSSSLSSPSSSSTSSSTLRGAKGGAQLPAAIETEHSYRWVEPELRAAFPLAKHCVLFPYFSPRHDDAATKHQLAETLAFASPPNTLILGTTDLIHYGPAFSTPALPFPQQLAKTRLEEPLIQGLVDADPAAVEAAILKSYKTPPAIADAPHVLTLLARVARLLGLRGHVVDYYDSSSTTRPLARFPPVPDRLDRYTIAWQPVETFVSYVGMVWERQEMPNYATRFDVMQAIGAVRSVIGLATLSSSGENKGSKNKSTNDERKTLWKALFPSWSHWRGSDTQKTGVFVGTHLEPGRRTNCSYGRFPEDPHTLAEKIVSAAADCPRDAADRWRIPYTLRDLETFGRVHFKVELLQPQEEWTWARATDLDKTIDLASGQFGVQLRIPAIGSATFLPVVAQEWPSSTRHGGGGANMVADYLDALAEKLGGRRGDWKREDAIVGIYQTQSFYWDPDQQTIV